MGPSMSIDGVVALNGIAAADQDDASMGPSMSIDGVTSPGAGAVVVVTRLQWGRR